MIWLWLTQGDLLLRKYLHTWVVWPSMPPCELKPVVKSESERGHLLKASHEKPTESVLLSRDRSSTGGAQERTSFIAWFVPLSCTQGLLRKIEPPRNCVVKSVICIGAMIGSIWPIFGPMDLFLGAFSDLNSPSEVTYFGAYHYCSV